MNILMVGCGSIGQAVLPLLVSRFPDEKISIVAADSDGDPVAKEFGLSVEVLPLNMSNYETVLAEKLSSGDMLLNLSVNVSSLHLASWCSKNEVFYLDTCVEPWLGGYDVFEAGSIWATTNAGLREEILSVSKKGETTAVVAHGANPGIISHLLKRGLLELGYKSGLYSENLAEIARELGIHTIHVAERDSQVMEKARLPGEFVNTWSVDGLLAEAEQLGELGWGTFNSMFPKDMHAESRLDKGVMIIDAPSASVKIRSWVPSFGEQEAFLITHHESLSIADFLTVSEEGKTLYRPNVLYAYHPSEMACDSLEEWMRDGFFPPKLKRVAKDELVGGEDVLGVLFVMETGSYWFGSELSLLSARKLDKFNNSTSMQTVSGIMGAIEWMLCNPREGVVEAENMDSDFVLSVAEPLLGKVFGVFTDWTLGGGDFSVSRLS